MARTLEQRVAPMPAFARGRWRIWTRRYLIDAPRSVVFRTYLASHPAETWTAPMVRFWAARTPDGRIVRAGDRWPPTSVGTRLCCGLRLLTPTDHFNVWTGVEVTAIEDGRRLRYEYLEGSTTAGSNEARFEDRGDQTLVTHRSEYCGATRLEHALIPLLEERFHGGFVDGMHAGLKSRCEAVHRCPPAGARRAGLGESAARLTGTTSAEASIHGLDDTHRHARTSGSARLRRGGGRHLRLELGL